MITNTIDLSSLFGSLAAVVLDPYVSFMKTLLAEGRITEKEYDAIAEQVKDRAGRLGDFIEQDHAAGGLNFRIKAAAKEPI